MKSSSWNLKIRVSDQVCKEMGCAVVRLYEDFTYHTSRHLGANDHRRVSYYASLVIRTRFMIMILTSWSATITDLRLVHNTYNIPHSMCVADLVFGRGLRK